MNLILTCPRNFEDSAEKEIRKILKELGDDVPRVELTKYPGILTLTTKIDSKDVIEIIKEKVIDEPWSIRYCLRIIPIQEITDTDISKIMSKIPNLTKKIHSDDSYRITVEKRDSKLSGNEIISEIAKTIPNKVSLENPEWIILIEIIGEKTGMSLVKKNDILSV